MTKKEYMKPTMEVVKIHSMGKILAGSVSSVSSSGLDDEDLLFGNGDDNIWLIAK